MRPTRLELQGFASFREPTVVDFSDTDLFVLTGQTGAGKSSIIDAMTFCLYGSVPRYDDRRLVAPAITQGLMEAKVRLDFTVAGRDYTAVRIVRRTKTGATTKEARLEDGTGATLAGNEKELTAAVERIVGLTFEHFTSCVVLPQGDFAEFLHAKPKERQDLLVELLDLSVYRSIGQAARARAADRKAQATGIETHLANLADATDERRDELAGVVAGLEVVVAKVQSDVERLDELRTTFSEARGDVASAREVATRLAECAPPDGTAALADHLRTATEALETAAAQLEDATERAEAAELARTDLGDAAPLRAAAAAHARRTVLIEQRDTAQQAVLATEEAAKVATDDAARADEALVRTRHDLGHLRTRHAAVALAADLHAGDPCPVCARPVDEAPDLAAPADLTDAEAALDAAEREAGRARLAAQRAESERQRSAVQLEGLDRQLTELADEVRDHPDATAVAAALQAMDEAEARVAEARAARQSAKAEAAAAKSAVTALDEARRNAWKAFHEARDAVGDRKPPTPPEDDLAGAWDQLTAWAQDELGPARDAVKLAEERLANAREEGERIADEHVRLAAEVGVKTTAQRAQADLLAAVADSRAAHQQVVTKLAEAAGQRQRLAEVRREEVIAADLGKRLSARNFEAWLLNRALAHLVVGASTVLLELSDGGYSLDLDDSNQFTVIDHRNADERRSARTLSGGETFLASLALALALAEHVADLAAHGSARLEALFLDEGFGTLDADTLDTVAVAVEELGARGRMVGIVTHVRDLAERLPVRFEVTKTPTGSRVEKVTR